MNQHQSYLGQLMVASNFSLPDDMRFGDAQIISITAYSIMLLIGLSTNWTFLYYLVRERLFNRDRNRMSLLLIHLSVADLLVRLYILKFCYLSHTFLFFRLFCFNFPWKSAGLPQYPGRLITLPVRLWFSSGRCLCFMKM